MVDLRVTVEFDGNAIDRKLEALEEELAKAVAAAGLKLETLAKLYAPVDTGFLRNSIHLILFGGSAPDEGGNSEVSIADTPTSRLEAIVAVGAEYGIYVEYGHYVERTGSVRKFDSTSRGVGYGKKTVRRAASRLADRQVGTYVQGVFYMNRAMRETEPYFKNRVSDAVKKASAA